MSGPIRDVDLETEEAIGRIVATMMAAFNAQLAVGVDPITASIELTAVGQRLATAMGLAWLSGAAHELEFYGGDR
jgi:hypothetical protein